jgi:hypothetical protein
VNVGKIQASNRTRGWTLAFIRGLVAGTLDITYACVFWALSPDKTLERIYQSVAKGLLGPAAYQGGTATAALALLLQYLIAISMSFTYFFVALRWAALRERALTYGAAYGLLLYAIMNYVFSLDRSPEEVLDAFNSTREWWPEIEGPTRLVEGPTSIQI